MFSLVIVSDLVSVQRGSLAETFPTDVTDVRLLTRVDILVVQQLIGRSKESAADQALVSLIAVVSQQVSRRVGDGAAILTVKTAVSLLLMASQRTVIRKLPISQRAVLHKAKVG